MMSSSSKFAAVAFGMLWACSPAQRAAQYPHGAMGQEAAVARARADSLRYPYTAADIRFMAGMIHHHAQAIKMARWAATHGASSAVQRLCERVINAQTDEISLMSSWLRDRRQNVPEPNPEGMKMVMGGAEHVMPMPGMLSAEQMRQLDTARGQEFDRLFLTFMIQHHRGAVAMVDELLGSHGAGQDATIFKFAADVHIDQTTGINRTTHMLMQLGSRDDARCSRWSRELSGTSTANVRTDHASEFRGVSADSGRPEYATIKVS